MKITHDYAAFAFRSNALQLSQLALKIISLFFIILALTNFSLFAESLTRGEEALENAEFELAIEELTPMAELP